MTEVRLGGGSVEVVDRALGFLCMSWIEWRKWCWSDNRDGRSECRSSGISSETGVCGIYGFEVMLGWFLRLDGGGFRLIFRVANLGSDCWWGISHLAEVI